MEDTFETDQRSTEIPGWERQRMAQQAEFERELLRQAEERAKFEREVQEEEDKRGRPLSAVEHAIKKYPLAAERGAKKVRMPAGDEQPQKDRGGAGVRRRQLQASGGAEPEPELQRPAGLTKKDLGAEMHKHLAEVVEKEKEKEHAQILADLTDENPTEAAAPAPAGKKPKGFNAVPPNVVSHTDEEIKEELKELTEYYHIPPPDEERPDEEPDVPEPTLPTVAPVEAEAVKKKKIEIEGGHVKKRTANGLTEGERDRLHPPPRVEEGGKSSTIQTDSEAEKEESAEALTLAAKERMVKVRFPLIWPLFWAMLT